MASLFLDMGKDVPLVIPESYEREIYANNSALNLTLELQRDFSKCEMPLNSFILTLFNSYQY